MIQIITDHNTAANQFFHELRDINIQKDRQRFEKNIERISTIAAYELSKKLDYKSISTKTSFGIAKSKIIKDKLVIAAILRAGLPVQRGLLNVFDGAEQAFIGAYRQDKPKETGFDISINYVASPALDEKILIIADTVIATGNTIVDSYKKFCAKAGKPKKTYIIGVIASQLAVDRLQEALPEADLMLGAVDTKLNKNFWIVPGLGDAGDLLFGEKL